MLEAVEVRANYLIAGVVPEFDVVVPDSTRTELDRLQGHLKHKRKLIPKSS